MQINIMYYVQIIERSVAHRGRRLHIISKHKTVNGKFRIDSEDEQMNERVVAITH